MSDTVLIPAPDTAAAELALGLLEGVERADAMRRVLAEPAFAAEVERWRTHFAALVAAVPDIAPPDALFGRIADSLVPVSASAPVPLAVAPIRRGWAWPSIAVISSMAAALLLAVTLTLTRPAAVVPTPERPTAPALLAAAVVPTTPGDAVSAVYDPSSGALRLTAAALADQRHAAELWVIGGDGVPHSLGLLRGGSTTALTVAPSDRPRLAAAAVLAVSIEPLGGSPTGLPTGPVVAKGVLSRT